MQKAEVYRLKPYFLDTQGTADFLGLSKKSVSNALSDGTFPIKPIYWHSKPLFPYTALLEYARALEQDSSEPAKKRGRKRVCKDEGQEPSRIAAEINAIKNPAGRRGGDGLTSRGGESQ